MRTYQLDLYILERGNEKPFLTVLDVPEDKVLETSLGLSAMFYPMDILVIAEPSNAS